jgi:hypothetical protein
MLQQFLCLCLCLAHQHYALCLRTLLYHTTSSILCYTVMMCVTTIWLPILMPPCQQQ